MRETTQLNLLRTLRVLTLVLVAGTLGMGLCHVMELPAKQNYGDAFYAAVNSTLYESFGPLASIIFPLEIAMAAALAAMLYRRGQVSFVLASLGRSLLAGSLIAWVMIVSPINQEAHSATATQVFTDTTAVGAAAAPAPSPEVIDVWRREREHWERGNLITFGLQLAGFIALLISAVAEETSKRCMPVTGREKVVTVSSMLIPAGSAPAK